MSGLIFLLTFSSSCVPMGSRRGYLFHIYVVRRGVAAHNPADVFLGNFPARRARNMVNRKFVVDLFVFLCSNGGIGSLFFHMFYCPPGVAAHNRRAFFLQFPRATHIRPKKKRSPWGGNGISCGISRWLFTIYNTHDGCKCVWTARMRCPKGEPAGWCR